MLELLVKYVPHGNKENARVIAKAEITNDGTGDRVRANYKIKISKYGRPNHPLYAARVTGFNRNRSSWDLIYEAIRALIEKDNKNVKAGEAIILGKAPDPQRPEPSQQEPGGQRDSKEGGSKEGVPSTSKESGEGPVQVAEEPKAKARKHGSKGSEKRT